MQAGSRASRELRKSRPVRRPERAAQTRRRTAARRDRPPVQTATKNGT